MSTPRSLRWPLAVVALFSAACAAPAQEAPAPAGPPLAPFAAMRLAVVPAQLWRADTIGWSREANWAELRLALDAAIEAELRARGLGSRWAYAADVVRTARRNPIYSTDPYALGVGRWRSTPPKVGDGVPEVVADNLRPITALGDTRYALIPVELRVEGDLAILRLVLADTRARSIVWAGDFGVPGGAGAVAALAVRIADLVVEP
ncbi:MAG: hypothetical protein WD771_08630 [Gemmatimonadaceae bacterium]